jgi:uncharacterized protein (TIGR02145 family)
MRNSLKFCCAIILILVILITKSCKKDSTDLPTLTTSDITGITPVAAAAGGEVTNDGGDVIISKGICWNTSQNPTTENFKTISISTKSSFTGNLSQLTPGTLYYVRAFATNSAGTGYGNQVTFTTQPPDPVSVTDADGNPYGVVRFGTQLWMKENLKTTKYPDGTIITLVNSDFTWGSMSITSKAYCWLNDDINNKDSYGALYTWPAALGACPAGWHLPGDDEWTTLITYLGGTQAAGSNLRDSGNDDFNALSGGTRTSIGSFFGANRFGYWWTSTPFDPGNAWNLYLDFNSFTLFKGANYNYAGNSVRCLRDN